MAVPRDPIRTAADAIARAGDPADVVGALAEGLLRTCGGGCTIDLFASELPGVAFVRHVQRELVATMRDARGADSFAESALVASAIADRRVTVTSFGQQHDPVERVRLTLRAETATVVPLLAGGAAVGVVVLFGRAPREDILGALELLATASAATIDRMLIARRHGTEVAVRDASIAMLTALTERSPIPTVFLDVELHVVVTNDAFAESQRATHDDLFRLSLDSLELPDRATLRRVIREVLESGEPRIVEVASIGGPIGERRSLIVAVHPVESGGVIAAVGLSLLDISSRRRAEDAARALADASGILSAAQTVRAARETLVELANRWLGELAILREGSNVVFCRPGPAEPHLEKMLAALPAELAPSRVEKTGVPLAVTADDAALLALSREALRSARQVLDAGPLLHVPVGGALVLTVARARDDYSPEEITLAVDLARLAQRAFEAAAAREEVHSWTVLFNDFLATVSRDLRDPITALIARLFVVQHASEQEIVLHVPALRRQAERLRDVAQRILAAAPRPPGETRDPIDLISLVSDASAGARALVEARGARVVVDTENAPPVAGDRRRLSDALREVMLHAAAETPPAGIFCIRTHSTMREVTISVSHNGEGLAAADARRVFDALWDGRAEGRALTIARAVFSAHGGRTWVETAPGTGTAYCFALPVDDVVSSVA